MYFLPLFGGGNRISVNNNKYVDVSPSGGKILEKLDDETFAHLFLIEFPFTIPKPLQLLIAECRTFRVKMRGRF
jgi:hypothetical protein